MPSFRRSTPRSPITCKYLVYRLPSRQNLLLPLVNVRLESDQDSVDTVGLVDSGSTVTFIPYELDKILSPPHIVEDSESIGAGGTFPTFISKLKRLCLLKGTTLFAEFANIAVHVPKRSGRIPYVILGRDTIFQRFHVEFQEKRRRVILSHHKWSKPKKRV